MSSQKKLTQKHIDELRRESWLIYLDCLTDLLCLLVLCYFSYFAVPWFGLQGVIVVFPEHTQFFLFLIKLYTRQPDWKTWCSCSMQKATLLVVREPVIGLIKWLRPKGLKVCSYVEKCTEFKKIKLLQKSAGTQKCYAQRNTPRVCNISKKR